VSCTAPREETFVEAYRRLHNPVGGLASLPSVPLRFLNQLARYLPASVVWVDYVVQDRVCVWLQELYSLKRGGRDVFKGRVGLTELLLFNMGQRCKIELQYLLRRYLPPQGNPATTTSIGELAESGPQFLPRINSWVSLQWSQ
jgi:hypothetical protein